jgi:hypothetical protein
MISSNQITDFYYIILLLLIISGSEFLPVIRSLVSSISVFLLYFHLQKDVIIAAADVIQALASKTILATMLMSSSDGSQLFDLICNERNKLTIDSLCDIWRAIGALAFRGGHLEIINQVLIPYTVILIYRQIPRFNTNI